eukprot:6198294-Pleurochrysis_carterae.AAC.4
MLLHSCARQLVRVLENSESSKERSAARKRFKIVIQRTRRPYRYMLAEEELLVITCRIDAPFWKSEGRSIVVQNLLVLGTSEGRVFELP